MEELTIRLEERVSFIQADIAEIKTDYRRLDAKVDATRDSVSDVKESVAALRVETIAGFRAVDRQTSAIEVTLGLLNGSLTALHTKVEDLSVEMRETRADVRETREDLRNETRALSTKIDETRTSLLDSCNVLFDRKFFRAMGVFGSALPLLAAAFTYSQRTALGMAEIAVIAAGMSVLIFLGTYLATRTHR